MWEGVALEERYIQVPRRQAGRREAPPRQAAPSRQAPPARARRKAAGRRPARSRRSPAVSVAVGLYKVLVVLSAIIVAVYIGVQLMARAPEQVAPPDWTPSQDHQGVFSFVPCDLSCQPGGVTLVSGHMDLIGNAPLFEHWFQRFPYLLPQAGPGSRVYDECIHRFLLWDFIF